MTEMFTDHVNLRRNLKKGLLIAGDQPKKNLQKNSINEAN